MTISKIRFGLLFIFLSIGIASYGSTVYIDVNGDGVLDKSTDISASEELIYCDDDDPECGCEWEYSFDINTILGKETSIYGDGTTIQGCVDGTGSMETIWWDVYECDDEPDYTLVEMGDSVISIQIPLVVCVGGNVSVSATLDGSGLLNSANNLIWGGGGSFSSSSGLSSLVLWNSPGTKTITAKNDSQTPISKTVNVISIETETYAEFPTTRTRKTIGVGEPVTVRLVGHGSGPITWSLDGQATSSISTTSGDRTVLTAGDRAGTEKVTANYGGCNVIVEFTVVEPSGFTFEQTPSTGIYHVYNQPSCGFRVDVYMTPSNVSFDAIKVIEGVATATAVNYFSYQNGQLHAEWPNAAPVHEPTSSKGSKMASFDQVIGTSDLHTPYIGGTFKWDLPWSFKVGGGDWKLIANIEHLKTIDSNGKLTLKKGIERSSNLSDPNSSL